MENYLHRIVGIYATRTSAEAARDHLLHEGFPPSQVRILSPGDGVNNTETVSDSDDVLKDILRDGAIGTAAGSALAAAGSIALAAANLTLFVASPLLGAIYLIGWGASVGGLVGAVVGADRSDGDVSSLVRNALADGQVVLYIQAATEDQTTLARRITGQSMSDSGAPSGLETRSPLIIPS